MTKLKVILVGPKNSGKTTIANYVTNQTETIMQTQYLPTVACRILEGDYAGNNGGTTNVELWDASGDNRYEACWKAIMVDSDAVIIAYNPDIPGHDQQLTDWYDFFVRKNGLREEQCLIFANRANPTNERFRAPPLFAKVASLVVNGTQNASEVRGIFENFVKEVSGIRGRK